MIHIVCFFLLCCVILVHLQNSMSYFFSLCTLLKSAVVRGQTPDFDVRIISAVTAWIREAIRREDLRKGQRGIAHVFPFNSKTCIAK